MTPAPIHYRQLLIRYLWPQRGRLALLVLLLLGSIGLQLLGPLLLRQFLDSAVAGAPLETLLGLAALFLVAAVVGQLVGAGEIYVAEDVGLTATNRLRRDLLLHCLQLDPAFHNANTPGALIERVDGDVGTLGNFFSRFLVQMVGNGLLLVGILVLLTLISWWLGLALAALLLLAFGAITGLRQVVVPAAVAARQSSADLFGFLEERLNGTEDIRANGAVGYVLYRLHQRSRAFLEAQRRADVLGVTAGNVTWLLLAIITAVSLGLGMLLLAAGAITVGTLYLIYSYAQSLSHPIEQLSRRLQDFQQATASLGRISALLEQQSVIGDGAGPPLPVGALPVTFTGVSFGYPDDQVPVLQAVDFVLPAGVVLGVLGRTGSGKTTLTRLLFRLYDPTAGAVHLAGRDLRERTVADLRQRIGLVSQEIQLFHASLRDNLTLFDQSITDERILAALTTLELDEWYARLPDGLATLLAPGGTGLSAGEAQLLAFARVFLRDPGLVILDEASSRLDPATERRLERAIDRLLHGRTAIIIAHRLATVQRADQILILDGGRVVEWGERRRLASDPNSRFAGLLRTGLEEALV